MPTNSHISRKGTKCERGKSAFRHGEPSKKSLNLKLSEAARDQLQEISVQLEISRSEVIEQLLRHHSELILRLLQESND